MSSSQWVRTSAGVPCPICQNTQYCSVTANGRVAMCMRIGQSSYREGTNGQGAT